jgi:hypothetical protein
MIDETISDLRKINLNNIIPNGFVKSDAVISEVKKLKPIKVIVDELLDIKEKVELPAFIETKINNYNAEIINFIKEIQKQYDGTTQDITQKKDRILGQLAVFSANSFILSTSSNKSNQLLEVYAVAKSFVKKENEPDEEIEKLKTELSNKLSESE